MLFPVYILIILCSSFLEQIGNCSRPDQFLVARAASVGIYVCSIYTGIFSLGMDTW